MARTDSRPRLSHIDSVRGLASMAVIVFHILALSSLFSGGAGPGLGFSYRTAFYPLEIGVTIFLAISGFLLYQPFLRAHTRGTPMPSIGAYSIRRLLRIFPPYWFALTVSALVFGWWYIFNSHGVLDYYGLAMIYRTTSLEAIAPAWTLGLELSFYVFLPIWVLAVRRFCTASTGTPTLRFHAYAVLGLFCASALYQVGVVLLSGYGGLIPPRMPLLATLPAHLSDFALGMGLAVLKVYLDDNPAPRIVSFLMRRPWLPVGVAAAAYLVATQTMVPPIDAYSHRDYAIRGVIFVIAAFGVMFPAAIGMPDKSLVARSLSFKPLVLLGPISYGIYLWHWSVLQFIGLHFPSWLGLGYIATWFVVAIAATIAIGALSYLIIEKPSIELGRTLGKRWTSRRAVPDAALRPEKTPA